MAAVDLPVPRSAGRTGVDPGPGVTVVGDADGGFSLRVFDAGLACCAVEVEAALRRHLAGRDGAQTSVVHVFVVAGTVTDKLAPHVLKAYQDTPEPRRVLSFGACANSGGPYWDSYCVTKASISSSRSTSRSPAARPAPKRCWMVWRCSCRGPGRDAGGDRRCGRWEPAAGRAVRG